MTFFKVKKTLLLIIGFIVTIFIGFIVWKGIGLSYRQKDLPPGGSVYNSVNIKIAGTEIPVFLVLSEEEKRLGLPGRKSLPDKQGMLFVFDTKSYQTFWMKDMLIPIDIIWISDDIIVDISKNVPNPVPGTVQAQLPLYSSSKPANYVLEVNAGFSDKYSIKIGDKVDLSEI